MSYLLRSEGLTESRDMCRKLVRICWESDAGHWFFKETLLYIVLGGDFIIGHFYSYLKLKELICCQMGVYITTLSKGDVIRVMG